MSTEQKQPTISEMFRSAFTPEPTKQSNVAIFAHSYPDPDAVGSMLSVSWLMSKLYGCTCNMFYTGAISHPQNKAVITLLEPNMLELKDYEPDKYDYNVIVDCVPENAGIPENTKVDLVIDHHVGSPGKDFEGVHINVKTGSCCSIVYSIIDELNLTFDQSKEKDKKIATAMIIGVITDTEHLVSDDTTNLEFKTYSDLFSFRDSVSLKQIIKFKRPPHWVEKKASAFSDKLIKDGYCVVGLGRLSSDDRDLIADIADEMLTWPNVDTSVAFAIIDGHTIEGCMRSQNASIIVPKLCKDLGTELGGGGGKLGKGAYRYSMGAFTIEPEDDDSDQKEDLDFIIKKETRRIFKMVHRSSSK